MCQCLEGLPIPSKPAGEVRGLLLGFPKYPFWTFSSINLKSPHAVSTFLPLTNTNTYSVLEYNSWNVL